MFELSKLHTSKNAVFDDKAGCTRNCKTGRQQENRKTHNGDVEIKHVVRLFTDCSLSTVYNDGEISTCG